MPSTPFHDSPLTPKHASLLAAVSALLFWLSWLYWHGEAIESSREATTVKPFNANTSAVFGPGAWTPTSQDSKDSPDEKTLKIQPDNIHPEDGLQLTERGDLLPNLALLELINAYLKQQVDTSNTAALRDYLRRRLPPPAYQQASQILDNYLAYIKAHDDYLAAQNLREQADNTSMQNILRIASWRLQRDRLRRSLLGEQITQAWYQNEDVQLKQAMIELLQRTGVSDSHAAQIMSLPTDEPIRPTAHWNDVTAEESYRLYLLTMLNAAVRSLDHQSQKLSRLQRAD